MTTVTKRALEFECTLCGAHPGDSCVFIPTLYFGAIRSSKRQMARDLLNGTPTQRPHNARFVALWEYEKQERNIAKQQQLRDWFEQHGDIFKIDD